MFTSFQHFADLCLKNYPFLSNSRLRLKNCPFFRESGYDRGVRFGRELGAGDYRPKLAAKWLNFSANITIYN